MKPGLQSCSCWSAVTGASGCGLFRTKPRHKHKQVKQFGPPNLTACNLLQFWGLSVLAHCTDTSMRGISSVVWGGSQLISQAVAFFRDRVEYFYNFSLLWLSSPFAPTVASRALHPGLSSQATACTIGLACDPTGFTASLTTDARFFWPGFGFIAEVKQTSLHNTSRLPKPVLPAAFATKPLQCWLLSSRAELA